MSFRKFASKLRIPHGDTESPRVSPPYPVVVGPSRCPHATNSGQFAAQHTSICGVNFRSLVSSHYLRVPTLANVKHLTYPTNWRSIVTRILALGAAALTVFLAVGFAATSEARACGGFFDVACNVGKSIEKAAQDVGRAIEKSAQDTGKTIDKAAQDIAHSPTNPCKLNPDLPQCRYVSGEEPKQ
jgi:hypothetical protein